MAYNFKEIEKKWQQYWKDNQTYNGKKKEHLMLAMITQRKNGMD